MAIIKCPECGADVSDKAQICPNCGAPLAKKDNSAAKSSFKTGSIIGLIGGIAMIVLLLLVSGGQLSADNASNTGGNGSINVDVSVGSTHGTAAQGILIVLGFAASCAATILFAIGLARGGRMGQRSAKRLSVSAIVVSAIGLFGLISFYGLIAICGGWLFLWQPVLELTGAIKMYQGANRYEEG